MICDGLIEMKTKRERYFEANDKNVFPTLKNEFKFAFFAAFLRIQGNETSDQIAQMETALRDQFYAFETQHWTHYVADAHHISLIVGKNGRETISQIADATGARLRVIREHQAAELEIIGTAIQVGNARVQVYEILQTHYQRVLDLDSLSIACLIGKKGEWIKALREEHLATTISISVKLGHVRVKANASEPLDACVHAILNVLYTI
ncbi:unnamed protein product [Albugo candida]|uniref:K Homology domain-containing protein n=1 Tax=Albugo candida TaxID=65357 RepID=A0A024FUV2_9STRA|nr:unnamed protein product [Albugo candida]|eukprot:CCI10419.1 unnamed protein product [Albugo candida]